MTANELWNLLSCHGPNEKVTLDATGLKIGPHSHIEVPQAPHVEVYKNGCGEIIATTRVDL